MRTTVTQRESRPYASIPMEVQEERPQSAAFVQRQIPRSCRGELDWLRRAKRILVLSLAAGMPCILTASPPQTPIFTTNPSSQTVASGGTATFTASASGSPTYQWYFAFNGVTNLIGTGSSVSVTSAYANEGSYFCVASNSYGATTSSVASLGVQ